MEALFLSWRRQRSIRTESVDARQDLLYHLTIGGLKGKREITTKNLRMKGEEVATYLIHRRRGGRHCEQTKGEMKAIRYYRLMEIFGHEKRQNDKRKRWELASALKASYKVTSFKDIHTRKFLNYA